MKMLMIVFRDSLEREIKAELHVLGVTAYTELDDVSGVGDAGVAKAGFFGMQDNTLVLAALPDDHAEAVIAGLQRFRDRVTPRRPNVGLPFRVFMLPCEQVV